jgi:nitrogen fixation protein FixH
VAFSNPAPAGLSGNIQFYRPSAINLDRQVKLEPNREGIQTIDASSLLPGLWKVRVSWKAGNEEYFLDEKVVIGTASS